MKLLWKVTKTTLLVSVLLLCGQIPIGDRTVGGHLAHQIYVGIAWVSESLRDAEWFAKMSNEDKKTSQTSEETLKRNRVAIAPKASPSTESIGEVEKEAISPEDRSTLVEILEP